VTGVVRADLPLARALAADDDVVVGEGPSVLEGRVPTVYRKWIADVGNSLKDLHRVALRRALVQSLHAPLLTALSRLQVRREHPLLQLLPLWLHATLPRRGTKHARRIRWSAGTGTGTVPFGILDLLLSMVLLVASCVRSFPVWVRRVRGPWERLDGKTRAVEIVTPVVQVSLSTAGRHLATPLRYRR